MALLTGTPYDTVEAFGGYNLGTTDSFYLGPNVVVFATGIGANGTGSNHSAIIQGTLIGSSGIHLGDNGGVDNNASVKIFAGGAVSGYGLIGVKISSANAKLENAGTITGGSYGVSIVQGGDSTATIVNSGLILSNFVAVENPVGGKVLLTNTGEIRCLGLSPTSYNAGSFSVDILINQGLMVGEVNLRSENDSYDGRGGRVIGTVYGEGGSDKLTGGNFSELFNGGAGTDTLTGGLAKDVLTGGTESDKFVFNAVAEIGDTITDFTTADFMVFKSSAFGSLTKGTLSSAAFRSNESGKAQDASDRFIYETDTDKLWYDKDGTGGSAHVLVTDFSYNVNMTRGDILIA